MSKTYKTLIAVVIIFFAGLYVVNLESRIYAIDTGLNDSQRQIGGIGECIHIINRRCHCDKESE